MLRIFRSDRGKTQTYEKECKLFETTQIKHNHILNVPKGQHWGTNKTNNAKNGAVQVGIFLHARQSNGVHQNLIQKTLSGFFYMRDNHRAVKVKNLSGFFCMRDNQCALQR